MVFRKTAHWSLTEDSASILATQDKPLSEALYCAATGKSLKFVDFFGCCTTDLQADNNQNQLNNNMKIDKLDTFASDWYCGM